jgi:hypothetical protein
VRIIIGCHFVSRGTMCDIIPPILPNHIRDLFFANFLTSENGLSAPNDGYEVTIILPMERLVCRTLLLNSVILTNMFDVPSTVTYFFSMCCVCRTRTGTEKVSWLDYGW